jgi:hypothetical protein
LLLFVGFLVVLDVWMFGRLVVRSFSHLVVWLFGCLVVWLFGCLFGLFICLVLHLVVCRVVSSQKIFLQPPLYQILQRVEGFVVSLGLCCCSFFFHPVAVVVADVGTNVGAIGWRLALLLSSSALCCDKSKHVFHLWTRCL